MSVDPSLCKTTVSGNNSKPITEGQEKNSVLEASQLSSMVSFLKRSNIRHGRVQ
jgi:hypothetical protein